MNESKEGEYLSSDEDIVMHLHELSMSDDIAVASEGKFLKEVYPVWDKWMTEQVLSQDIEPTDTIRAIVTSLSKLFVWGIDTVVENSMPVPPDKEREGKEKSLEIFIKEVTNHMAQTIKATEERRERFETSPEAKVLKKKLNLPDDLPPNLMEFLSKIDALAKEAGGEIKVERIKVKKEKTDE